MTIYLASTSSLKKSAVQNVLTELSKKQVIQEIPEVLCKYIVSVVPPTPLNAETFLGARHRAKTVAQLRAHPEGCFVGLESGLVERHGILFEECWCVLQDGNGNEYCGYSSGYPLPQKIRNHIEKGGTHLEALEALEKESGISRRDTWAIYSKNTIKRAKSIEEAFRNAFLSFLYK